MRIRLPLFLVVGLALSAAACSSSSSGEDTSLRVVRTESFDSWELDSAAAYATYQTHAAVLEGLLRVGSDGASVEAGLAETWSYDPDAKTWTFELRDGAAFSDGTPVTSADVAFSARVWKKGPNFGGSYSRLERVETPDERTVVFHLSSRDANFEPLLAASVSGVMPANFGGRTAKEYYANPVGAGAYQVGKWSPGGRIELTRNPSFYDPERPGPAAVAIDVVPDENERALLFEAGDADVVEYVAASAAERYTADQLIELPLSQVEHLSLNVSRGPLGDVAVRRAIALAINYRDIVDGAFAGRAELPNGILAPNLKGWVAPSSPQPGTDLGAAKTSLSDSKGAAGFDAEVVYDAGLETDTLVAQVLKANLEPLGIELKLTGLETGAFLDRAFGLDADMVVWSYGAVSPEIADPLSWIIGTGWLFSGFDTKPLEAAYEDYVAAADETAGRRAIVGIQDAALDELPSIALAHYAVRHAIANRVGSFSAAPWGLYYYDTLTLDG